MLEALTRPASGTPEGALVLLHGRGASEHDLFPLLDAFDPERRLLGVTPRAPLSLPPGGWHWYRLGGIPTPERTTFLDSLARGAAFLYELPVPAARIVLGGFSQGAVMSLALGLGRGRPRPAGILALSGFVPEIDGFELDLDEIAGYRIAVTHGTLDSVIPVEYGRTTRAMLEAAGATVLWRETAVGHTVDPRIVPDIVQYVRSSIEPVLARQ